MKVFYPKKYRDNQKFPENVLVEYYDDVDSVPSFHDGMMDSFSLLVIHREKWVAENYGAFFENGEHHFMIKVDCEHQSKNLDDLLSKLIKWEDIWNEG
jgi:hypothetical protein